MGEGPEGVVAGAGGGVNWPPRHQECRVGSVVDGVVENIKRVSGIEV